MLSIIPVLKGLIRGCEERPELIGLWLKDRENNRGRRRDFQRFSESVDSVAFLDPFYIPNNYFVFDRQNSCRHILLNEVSILSGIRLIFKS